jgi:hypothetical protein
MRTSSIVFGAVIGIAVFVAVVFIFQNASTGYWWGVTTGAGALIDGGLSFWAATLIAELEEDKAEDRIRAIIKEEVAKA